MEKVNEEKNNELSEYFDDAVRDLSSLIKIDSVQSAPEPHAPFGAKVKAALDFMLARAGASRFLCADVDGYAGFCELRCPNPEAETLGVLTHLDVVPLGTGWTKEQGSISDGRVWGRGAIDNKGPTLACFYALKKIQKDGYFLRRNIRLIWGCNEESGNACMDYYAEKIGMPAIGFSPDGDFPIMTCEKTILHLAAQIPFGVPDVLGWTAGIAVNAVPALSVLRLSKNLQQKLTLCLKNHPNWGTARTEEDGSLTVTSTGKAAHAMTPFLGDNAAWKSAWILAEILGTETPPAFRQFVNTYCTDKALSRLGLEYTDPDSGSQTLNLGKLQIQGGNLVLSLDFRCPVPQNLDILKDKVEKSMDGCKLTPLYYAPYKLAEKGGELVRTLSRVYTKQSGLPVKYIITGGGTYARKMHNCVAFGPMVEGKNNNIHDADEYLELEHFNALMKMYFAAMVELAT